MQNREWVMKFPCTFPLKVMGLNAPEFPEAVLSVFEKHMDREQLSCATRTSSGNKYLSITVTFTASSREQLDTIYEELNSHPLVVMTL
jgi:putative lipoic acid-binding regulatory protein